LHSALGTETFGERIRRRRREDKLSQRQLASLVGVDFTYLSKLENDQDGQSPGEELVVKLAEQLHDDSEELLALAGKVPVEALRTLAREDADFARFLRRLSGVAADDKRERLRQVLESGAETDVGKLPELLAPLMEKGGLNDAHIVATLSYPPAEGWASDVLVRLRMDYAARQDEWLWGFVTDWSHRDRLRDLGVPLDDIEVLWPTAIVEQLRGEEIVRAYNLLVRYRDGEAPFEEVQLERLTDLSRVWRLGGGGEEFPLVVMRASFPPLADATHRRIELSYGCRAPRDVGYWFWTASAPTYVSTITVDARQLATNRRLTLMMALPNFVGRQEGVEGIYSVQVDRWVLPGHGVHLEWGPPDDGRPPAGHDLGTTG
jgi:HTH-type transcriptional regulator, competence development regulator